METIYILFVLIVALTGLVGLRKELETTKADELEVISDYLDMKIENTNLEESVSAHKWWGTKYREDIEDQADTIRRMWATIDEVHILLEKILVSKKKDIVTLVNEFTFKD